MVRARPLLPLLVAIPLLAGVALLGILLVGWVNQASAAEEARARAALTLGAARVRVEAEDEVRIIASVLHATALELADEDWSALDEAAAFWYSTASYPGVIRAIWILRETPRPKGWLYSPDTGSFAAAVPPGELREALAETDTPRAPMLSGGDVVIRLPILDTSVEVGTEMGSIAVVLDTTVLYGQVIPAYMREHLPGFPFRVAVEGKVVYDEASAVGRRAPEFRIGLDAFGPLVSRLPFGEREGGERDGEPRRFWDDPSLRFWMLSGRLGRDTPRGDAGEADDRAVLEVFYPNRSLESAIQLRRYLSIGVGVGILAILTVSAGVLFGLYRRSSLLRASEQEFVASMSHELRTPIAVIQATSENLANSVVTDPGRLARYGRVIHEQVRRLSDMVEGILYYSGLQADANHRPNLTRVEPARLIDEITQPLSLLAANRGSVLVVRTDGLPPFILTDAVALRLIVENLITNAIRHADAGEIRLEATRRVYDLLRITVEDDGPGIPAREQRRVFEAFVRGEKSSRDQKPGSGLGLHLVRRVTLMLGGTVTLDSPYENLAGATRPGTRFTVTIPCREVAPDER